MVEKYVPKVGDKVRATLGGMVIEGEVQAMYALPDDLNIRPDSVRWSFTVRPSDGWHFEQIVSVPTKFGAVIRRADGIAYSLADPEAKDERPWVWSNPDSEWDSWATTDEATAGGFTVLFDGVDE